MSNNDSKDSGPIIPPLTIPGGLQVPHPVDDADNEPDTVTVTPVPYDATTDHSDTEGKHNLNHVDSTPLSNTEPENVTTENTTEEVDGTPDNSVAEGEDLDDLDYGDLSLSMDDDIDDSDPSYIESGDYSDVVDDEPGPEPGPPEKDRYGVINRKDVLTPDGYRKELDSNERTRRSSDAFGYPYVPAKVGAHDVDTIINDGYSAKSAAKSSDKGFRGTLLAIVSVAVLLTLFIVSVAFGVNSTTNVSIEATSTAPLTSVTYSHDGQEVTVAPGQHDVSIDASLGSGQDAVVVAQSRNIGYDSPIVTCSITVGGTTVTETGVGQAECIVPSPWIKLW